MPAFAKSTIVLAPVEPRLVSHGGWDLLGQPLQLHQGREDLFVASKLVRSGMADEETWQLTAERAITDTIQLTTYWELEPLDCLQRSGDTVLLRLRK